MKTIEGTMREIASADVLHGIFRVSLVTAAYLSGFDAVVDLRGRGDEGYPTSLSAHAATAEGALEAVRDLLTATFGRCPECGHHRKPEPRSPVGTGT